MDPGLHVTQGLNHLNRVLNYAQFVAEDGVATTHLTYEDWHVLADTLFHMQTPRELIPERVISYSLAEGEDIIVLTTEALRINVEIM